MSLCISPCASMGQPVRESVGVHDIHCGPKSYELKLLRKLVIYGLTCVYVSLHVQVYGCT